MSDFVSEAGHWYAKDGKPAYTQITASGKNKGKERPTTIRDARKQSLLPSVTTIASILDKPALTHWKIGRAVDMILWDAYNYLRKNVGSGIAPAFKLFFRVSKPDMEDKAGRGSEIHAALEQWLNGGGVEEGFEEYVDILELTLARLDIPLTDVVAERSFAADDGYGGAVDLSASTRNGIIIDFKTKDMDSEKCDKLKAYDEHVLQLGAYRRGLGMPEARLFNLFLSRDNPTVFKLVEWTEKEAQWGERTFLSVFSAWKLLKRYEPNV